MYLFNVRTGSLLQIVATLSPLVPFSPVPSLSLLFAHASVIPLLLLSSLLH
jgi:hypothetical protein